MSTSRKIDPRTPCIIGVARHSWRAGDDVPEPLTMWEQVVRAATADSRGRDTLSAVDSLKVVYCQSWTYDQPADRLAELLSISPGQTVDSGIGGSVPLVLLAETAEDIAAGRLDVGVVTGAEALATVRRLKQEGRKPEWSHRPAGKRPFPFDVPFHPSEVAHSVFEAYLTFALFDTARRAHLGRSIAEHAEMTGRLLAPLTRAAADDPDHSWFPVERKAGEIVNPSPGNRMVATPYTKLMTAFMDVDMAAALVVTSEEKADALGVPRDKRVYLRGWGYAEDPPYVAQRRDLWRSVAMHTASRAALENAGVTAEGITHLDLYSCFASSLAFGLDALGLDEGEFAEGPEVPPQPARRSATVTGGLPYHGGPGSNYVTHSIAAMVEDLRCDPGSTGIVSGVGMHMMKHAYGVFSTEPRAFRPCEREVLQHDVAAAQPVVPIAEAPEGKATVVTYSVLHDRDGEAASAVVVCDLPEGPRCYARIADPDSLKAAAEIDLAGTDVGLEPAGNGLVAATCA